MTLLQAQAHRMRIRGSWQRVVLQCPFCSESHTHADGLGVRIAHCGDVREYELVDPNGVLYVTGARRHLGPRCERCGAPEDLQAHHCDENQQNNSRANIQTLCGSCHRAWHSYARRICRSPSGRAPSIEQKAKLELPVVANRPSRPGAKAELLLHRALKIGHGATTRELFRMAASERINERTLRRAAKKLGVTYERTASGKSHTAVWRFPELNKGYPGDWDTVTE